MDIISVPRTWLDGCDSGDDELWLMMIISDETAPVEKVL
jgi:hypothetical protein